MTKPIRVLHLMNGFGDASISWIVHRIIHHASNPNNFNWYVSGLCGLGTMQEKFNQLEAHTIDFSKPLKSKRFIWQRIRQYLLDHEIQIIHTHTPRTIIQASLATCRMPQVAHLATKHLLTTPGDRRWGIPVTIFDRFGLYLPDQIVAVSNTMVKQILIQPGISPQRVRAICNAIPAEKYYAPDQRESCRIELGLSPESIAIGFAGRMEKVKRIDLLLFAHKQILFDFPETRLVLVGEGSEQDEWKSLTENLGISHTVIWAGFRTDMPRIMAALDIYVVPSVNEGLSLSILEAMAAGLPVIATDVGGASEVIIDNLSGLLVYPGSYQILAKAISDLLENPEKRERISRAGRDLVLNEYNIKRLTDDYCNLYLEIANKIGRN